MKTRIRLKSINIDSKRFTETLYKELETIMRNATRAWLRSVIEHVPVYLGTSRGSLVPLGQYLRVAIPITPAAHAHPRPGLGPEAGAAQGFFEFKRLQKKIQFSFKTNVAHYIINEFTDPRPEIHLTHDAPWHSFQFGREAFDRYLAENLKNRLPKIKDFIVREDIFIN